MKRLLLSFLGLCCAFSLYAGEYRRLGQDYRSLAMGNTGIVSATNNSALSYNPATMANIFDWWIDLPMFEATYSDEAKDLYDTAKDGGFNLETQEEQFDFMEEFVGQNPYIKARLGFNLYANVNPKGFTLGGNYTYEAVLDLKVRNPSLPQIEGLIRLDHVRQYGFSYPIGMGQLVLGMSYKTIERQELEYLYGMGDALNNVEFPTLEDDGTSGIGSGYDVGFLYRMDTAARVTLGGVYRKAIDLGEATPIPEEIALGIGSTQEWGMFRLSSALDLRDLTFKAGEEDDRSMARRTHLGFEFGIVPLSKGYSMFSIRTGLAQGHQSRGAEISLGRNMVFGYTQYYEETGVLAGQTPNHRTIVYFSMGI